MASRDAAHGDSPHRLDWPALGERATAPGGEVVYLWSPAEQGEEPSLPREEYLTALVGLVDELTQRLVASERALARAEAERDSARALAAIYKAEAGETARQLLAYCRALVDSNCALDESRTESGELAEELSTLKSAMAQVAQSPLALPVRARLMALAGDQGE